MRSSPCRALASLLAVIGGLVAPLNEGAAQSPASAAPGTWGGVRSHTRDLQLEVWINANSTGLIGSFKELSNGSLVTTPDEARAVGLTVPDSSIAADGLVPLSRLPGISYRIEEASQRLYVSAVDAARAPHVVNLQPDSNRPSPEAQRGLGGALDYTLFGSADASSWRSLKSFPALSAELDGRLFGLYGTFSQSFIASTAAAELGTLPSLDTTNVTRLQTTWTYSNPDRLVVSRAGDVISGGLSWTRPVWLGGVQIERDFALRPDLITAPLPSVSGSAAVPSTLDVYVQNVKAFSGQISSGPFQVSNLPITTGSGTAQLVLHDALGRATTTTLPFYASSQLLRPGLYDFSAEAGFPRRYYGIESDNYDDVPMGSGTLRYGWSNWLTFEGHAEGGARLINGGAGAVWRLGSFGVGSLAVAGSDIGGNSGCQYAASIELGYRGITLYARTQQTFGNYMDMAAVTANPLPSFNAPISIYDGVFPYSVLPPKVLDQISLTTPLMIDDSSLTVSFSEVDHEAGDRSRIVGLSYDRAIFHNSSIFATAFTDLDDHDNFSVFAGITIPLGRNISTSTGATSGPDGLRFAASAVKSEQQEVGSYGWYLRDGENPIADRAGGVSYRASFARLQLGMQQWDKTMSGTTEADGSIALLDGSVFFANRIDDAFAVVDAGAPNVSVQYENRPVGETNSRGVLLVPYLRSFQENKISIDPRNLAVDAEIPTTRSVVVPADHGGVMVKFGIDEASQAALVGFVDVTGKVIDVGAPGRLERSDQTFVVGYDGQAYLRGLAAHNVASIEQPNAVTCHAAFDYDARPGKQVTIAGVVCR